MFLVGLHRGKERRNENDKLADTLQTNLCKTMDTKIDQIDWGLVPVDPEPNFDAERNRRIIQETIDINENQRKRREREFGSKLKARSEAVAQYVGDLADGKTSSSVEKYFGQRELARLRGEEIANIIKAKLSDAKVKETTEKAKRAKVYS
jgi:hypothetical protein